MKRGLFDMALLAPGTPCITAYIYTLINIIHILVYYNHFILLKNNSIIFLIVRRPSDNPFYSNIDSMPDIRPRKKSIPLVSVLVRINLCFDIRYKKNRNLIQNNDKIQFYIIA